ncbi:MAG: alpha/beta fold hydrolase [Planctomycetota bacterium]|jgi:pimeloyl-ACP methyl ester carboxylesterase
MKTARPLLLALAFVLAFPAPSPAEDAPELTDRERIAAWVISNCMEMKPGEKPPDAIARKFKELTGFTRPQLDFDSGRIPLGEGAFQAEMRWTCRIRLYTPLQAKKNTQEAKTLAKKAHWYAKDDRTGAEVFVELKLQSTKAFVTFLRIRNGIYARVIVTVKAGPNQEVKQLVDMAAERWHFFYGEAERLELYLPAPDRFWARDLNPSLTEVKLDGLAKVPPERLAELGPDRDGVAADGRSQLLLVAKFERPGKVVFSTPEADGKIEPLYGRNPHGLRKVGKDIDEDGDPDTDIAYFGFALYTPPEEFGKGKSGRVGGTKMHFRNIFIEFRFTPENGDPLEYKEPLKLVRPPVLLVHGTFDNPRDCWRTKSPEGRLSFADALGRAGFFCSLVDYEATNAAGFGAGGFFRGGNARVLMDNAGGIKAVLSRYRDRLNLAVTQVDVVGHSLGGLIARIWASPAYNRNYERDENFGEGDIRRLVTIGTPHYGSDLGKILRWLKGVNREEHGVVATTAATAFTSYASWMDGASADEGAVYDQLPQTEALLNVGRKNALTKIGRTKIPAHAIVCVTEPYGYIEPDGRPKVDPGGEYLSSLEWTGLLFFKNPILLEDFFRDDQMEEEGWYIVDLLESQHMFFMEEDGVRERFENIAVKGLETQGVEPREVLEYFRMAMFGHDDNDMTVRAESQLGGLSADDPKASTRIDGSKTTNGRGVLHGKAPRYQSVQDAVIKVLVENLFDEGGFPDPGVQMKYREPAHRPDLLGLSRDDMIIWSGMVKEHAEAYSEVSREAHAIVLGRPVNPDSTRLIADSAATKDMSIKGKSSTWGPHKGCVPTEQRYSKIWRTKAHDHDERDADIATYDAEVKELLAMADGPAVPINLKVDAAGIEYDVMILSNEVWKERAEDAVVLRRRDSGAFFDWRNNKEQNDFTRENEAVRPRPGAAGQKMRAMQVLADRATGRILTAD